VPLQQRDLPLKNGDQYLIKFSYINKKHEANHFLKMFPETGKSFNREIDSSGIIDSCPGCGRLHTVHPIAKIN